MVIKIGAAESFARPSSWTTTPDDRQTKIEIIDGVHVQDYGVVDTGETISCTAIFNTTNWNIVKGYWVARTLVEIIGEDGVSQGDRRVVIKSYTTVSRFPKYITATLEFWGL